MSQALQAPGFAALAPGRAVETRMVGGRWQAVAWDLGTGRRRVVTDRPHGVDLSEIEPDGAHLWWFDADTSGEGRWRRQPFTDGGPVEALTGLPRGRAYGLAFDRAGSRAAVGIGVGGASHCYLGEPGGAGRLVGTAPGYLSLADLSPDGRLLALGGRPDGPDAVLLWPTDPPGSAPVRLPGGSGLRLWPIEFRPQDGPDPELLLIAELNEQYTVAIWRADRGLRPHPRLAFASEISVGWYGGARGVLVQQEQDGRSRLLAVDLDADWDGPREIPTPGGTIHDLSCAPDGTLHCLWSRTTVPPRPLLIPPGGLSADQVSPTVNSPHPGQRWTSGPAGPIHSFVSTPPGPGPWPTLFLVHGGPATHDRDSYDPSVGALVRHGYAVVRTNYRGSTGYGARWQREFGHRVGLAQLEDLAAVRAALVDEGVADPGRTGLCGFSWGGYLTLLGLGAQPQLWSLGMAAHPIADYPAVYRATTPALRVIDQELFGGTPQEVPERYRAASPLSYVQQVRSPVLLVVSEADERCPAEQVTRYAKELARLAVPHELFWTDGGHRSRLAADHDAVFAAMLRFAAHCWPTPPPP
ncbi:alpha/beta fold hydrolase [Kitasatospora viridis]|uniref:Acylaminoacyl-peptidase n=1 Tax=Kitasatospora viridis TaxID=281105 RepID=A0A561SFM7_9ACTN|nr:alpha/beta fold hydrolase [Kitasatospora viridis]TWF73685.1 acylaminoacyl-peptidase [Kitasatospora viridis]